MAEAEATHAATPRHTEVRARKQRQRRAGNGGDQSAGWQETAPSAARRVSLRAPLLMLTGGALVRGRLAGAEHAGVGAVRHATRFGHGAVRRPRGGAWLRVAAAPFGAASLGAEGAGSLPGALGALSSLLRRLLGM